MRTRPAAGALALGLALSLAGTLGLSTAGATADDRAAQKSPMTAAQKSLKQAKSLVTGRSGPSRDATEVLRELWIDRAALRGADARRAESILNRPSEPDDELGDYYGAGVAVESACGDNVCVHWAESGDEAADPGYAADVLETVDGVHQTYVDAGYKAPLPDDGQEGNTKPDIYLANIGDYAFGYCNTDQPEYRDGFSVYAFCVLDNDYAADEFGTYLTPTEFMQVTAAHEYFHAVQAAYDWEEDFWLLESTATWAEDELFDDINDNVFYLPYGQLGGPEYTGYPASGPGVSLDLIDFNAYGNWIWWRYLTEKFPAEQGGLPTLVRDVWRAADSTTGAHDDDDDEGDDEGDDDDDDDRGRGKKHDDDDDDDEAGNRYSLQAIQSVLSRRGTSLEREYAHFAVENNTPEQTYDEGAEQGYPKPDYAFPAVTLTPSQRKATQEITLDHLTSGTGAFLPSPEMGTGWKLKVEARMAARSSGSQAAVTVFGTGGQVARSFIDLDHKGKGKAVVPFSYADVASVEITLINASDRMMGCDQGTPYACGGTGVDDQLIQKLKVTASR